MAVYSELDEGFYAIFAPSAQNLEAISVRPHVSFTKLLNEYLEFITQVKENCPCA